MKLPQRARRSPLITLGNSRTKVLKKLVIMQYLAPGFLQFCQSFCEANDATKKTTRQQCFISLGETSDVLVNLICLSKFHRKKSSKMWHNAHNFEKLICKHKRSTRRRLSAWSISTLLCTTPLPVQ